MKHKFIDENENILYSSQSIKGLELDIIKQIKLHLMFSRNGCVDHYIDDKFTRRYSNNPKNGKASLEIDKGNKTYYRVI